MDATIILLQYLQAEHFIIDPEKAKPDVRIEKITLRKESDLWIRDAIIGMGMILKEDLENHYYITTVRLGTFGNILTQAIILRKDAEANVAVYAHEGLIKRRLAEKTIQKLKRVLE